MEWFDKAIDATQELIKLETNSEIIDCLSERIAMLERLKNQHKENLILFGKQVIINNNDI